MPSLPRSAHPVPRAPGPRAPRDPRRVPLEGARQGAPQAWSSAHPAPGPPRALAAPGLTFGTLSPLAGCCGCGAVGGHREEGRDSEWRRPPAPLSPAPGPFLTVLGLKFPHVAAGPGPTLRPSSQVQVRGSSRRRVDPARRATRGAWIRGRAVGRGLARQPETPARAAAGLPLSAHARDGALTAVLAAPPAAADRRAVDPGVSFTLRVRDRRFGTCSEQRWHRASVRADRACLQWTPGF